MFLLVAVGFFCGKKNIIDPKTNSKLSGIVLTIVNPVLIFMSYQREFKQELLYGLLWALGLSCISFIVTIFVIKLIYRKRTDAAAVVEKFASVYSNCGFMGIPLINGIFGAEGVFYITGCITMFNLFAWTHGVMMFSGKRDMSSVLHAVTSPAVIAVAAGFIFFLFRIELPEVIASAAEYIGSMNTPLAMLVAGVTISGTHFKTDMKNPAIWRVCLFKLILIPVIVWAMFRWLPIPETVFITVLAAAACPTAATCTMFSLRYEKEPQLSGVIFAATTLLSAVTIPLIIMLGGV